MLKKKLRSCLILWGLHTWRSVPYSFVELRLRVVVVGLPLLTVYEVAVAGGLGLHQYATVGGGMERE
jgi:hypothetical protein